MKLKQIDKFQSKLIDPSYDKPYEALKEIFQINELDNVLLEFILGLDDKLVLIEFLKGYEHFSSEQLERIEKYIEENLLNEDKLFASELIAIANQWNLISIYTTCIDLVKNENEDALVIIECIYMLFEHFEVELIEDVFEALETIMNSTMYYQSCQVVASFYLLRMSGHKKYFKDVEDLIKNGQEMNKEILTNILSQEYNQQRYFSHHDTLKNILK